MRYGSKENRCGVVVNDLEKLGQTIFEKSSRGSERERYAHSEKFRFKEVSVMKKRTNWTKSFVTIGLVFLMIFVLSGIGIPDVVTSNLNITPTPCKRGDVLRFSATIYNNPIIGTAPGTAYYGSVVLDNTNAPELNPWSTELQVFKYPTTGKTVTVNFKSTYTVPQNLKGETICFYVAEGKEKANKISYKTCIKVVTPIKPPIMKQRTTK